MSKDTLERPEEAALDKVMHQYIADLKRLKDWLDALSEHDKNNFVALINLPHAADMVVGMPYGNYRNMVVIALDVIKSGAKL